MMISEVIQLYLVHVHILVYCLPESLGQCTIKDQSKLAKETTIKDHKSIQRIDI